MGNKFFPKKKKKKNCRDDDMYKKSSMVYQKCINTNSVGSNFVTCIKRTDDVFISRKYFDKIASNYEAGDLKK